MDGYGKETQEEIHRWLMGQTPVEPPQDPKYCMLSTTSFDPNAGNMHEVTGLGYARVEVADSVWSLPTTDPITFITTTDNTSDIQFTKSGGLWGVVTSFAIMMYNTPVEYPTVDTKIYFGGDLDSSKTIDPDTIAVFAANNLKLQTLNSSI